MRTSRREAAGAEAGCRRTKRSLALVLLWAAAALTASGCGMPPAQRRQVEQLEADAAAMGHPEVKYVPHLDPQRAVGLGFAPFGLAGFYVERPGLGISGILLWPLSILWMPGMAELTAYEYNYVDLRTRVSRILEQARSGASAARPADPGDVLEAIERLQREGTISEGERDQMRQRVLDRMIE